MLSSPSSSKVPSPKPHKSHKRPKAPSSNPCHDSADTCYSPQHVKKRLKRSSKNERWPESKVATRNDIFIALADANDQSNFVSKLPQISSKSDACNYPQQMQSGKLEMVRGNLTGLPDLPDVNLDLNDTFFSDIFPTTQAESREVTAMTSSMSSSIIYQQSCSPSSAPVVADNVPNAFVTHENEEGISAPSLSLSNEFETLFDLPVVLTSVTASVQEQQQQIQEQQRQQRPKQPEHQQKSPSQRLRSSLVILELKQEPDVRRRFGSIEVPVKDSYGEVTIRTHRDLFLGQGNTA